MVFVFHTLTYSVLMHLHSLEEWFFFFWVLIKTFQGFSLLSAYHTLCFLLLSQKDLSREQDQSFHCLLRGIFWLDVEDRLKSPAINTFLKQNGTFLSHSALNTAILPLSMMAVRTLCKALLDSLGVGPKACISILTACFFLCLWHSISHLALP